MKKNYANPSYELICKATSGDEMAIQEILKLYNAYISKICLCPLQNGNSKTNMIVNSELKRKIQTEVIEAIMKFDFRIR